MRTDMRTHSCRGVSLLETVVYSAVFGFILLAVFGAVFSMLRASKTLAEERRVARSAHVALDRMMRDAREAEALGGTSLLNTHPGKLALVSGENTTEFYVESGALMAKRNTSVEGALTTAGVTVSSFVVSDFSSGSSTAVRIELQLEAGTSTSFFSKRFFTSAVFRNAY